MIIKVFIMAIVVGLSLSFCNTVNAAGVTAAKYEDFGLTYNDPNNQKAVTTYYLDGKPNLIAYIKLNVVSAESVLTVGVTKTDRQICNKTKGNVPVNLYVNGMNIETYMYCIADDKTYSTKNTIYFTPRNDQAEINLMDELKKGKLKVVWSDINVTFKTADFEKAWSFSQETLIGEHE